jgi:arylsulfatase A-like enzyme
VSRARRPTLRAPLAGALLLLAAACGKEKPPPAKPALGAPSYDYDGVLAGAERRAGPKPNVLVLCLAGVRADTRMASLEAFAKDAASFQDATSAAAWSLPSVASLLTGLLPAHHGVVDRADVAEERRPLNQAIPTIAEILKAQGYRTAAFVAGAPIGEDEGFAQGFDTFHTRFDLGRARDAVSRWLAEGSAPWFVFVHAGRVDESEGGPARNPRVRTVVDPLVAIAKERDGGIPPGAGADLLVARSAEPDVYRDAVERLGERWVLEAIHRWIDVESRDDAARDAVAAKVRQAYAERVQRQDAAVGRFLAALGRHVVGDDVVVVVTSDHGEAHGEHGALGAGRFLHEGLIRVPLLIRAPTRLLAGGGRGSVSLLDVVPTVLDAVGLPPPPECDGRSLLAEAARRPHDRVVVAQESRRSRGPGSPADLDVLSLRTERGKFVVTLDGRTLQATEAVYDLGTDPGEEKPLDPSAVALYGPEFEKAVGCVREQVRRLVANAQDLAVKGYMMGRVVPTLENCR